jgi:hypothetical protein
MEVARGRRIVDEDVDRRAERVVHRVDDPTPIERVTLLPNATEPLHLKTRRTSKPPAIGKRVLGVPPSSTPFVFRSTPTSV